ncbi:MAG: hypothetical protein F4053_06595 [Proteobacteria bacterium]|nr:hypothetical protein [Pseudomonadota bacterium]MYJ95251.1 hypothetical protein [Pseudomonadota bacterium]
MILNIAILQFLFPIESSPDSTRESARDEQPVPQTHFSFLSSHPEEQARHTANDRHDMGPVADHVEHNSDGA